MSDFRYNEFSSSKANDAAFTSIKQSAYFHHDKKKVDPLELRFQVQNDRIQQHEEQIEKRFEHLEERVKQVNQKFERIEQLGERLESLNKLIDTLKTNFDAKLMVYDDKLNVAQQRFEKKLSQMRVEIVDRSQQSSQDGSRGKLTQQDELANDMQQLYQILKKTQSSHRELQLEVSSIKKLVNSNQITKERDIRQSEVIFTKENRKNDQEVDSTETKKMGIIHSGGLKQSGIMNHHQQPNHQNSHSKPDSHQHHTHQTHHNSHQNQANSLQISSPTNHSRVESFKQQYHFGVTQVGTGTLIQKNDRVRSITLEKEKQIQQQDLESRMNKKEKISSQYLNTEEDDHEKKSRSRSKKVPQQITERNNEVVVGKYQTELVDKYQFTLQSKVLQTVDSNIQRVNQSESNPSTSLCSKSKSQQGQLRMTFNVKDEVPMPRDRISSKNNNHSSKESKTNFSSNQNKIIEPQDSGKYKADKQNLLERAISQDNFRSKYLSSDKVGKIYRVEEDQEKDYINLRK